jgi:hypothetical protein
MPISFIPIINNCYITKEIKRKIKKEKEIGNISQQIKEIKDIKILENKNNNKKIEKLEIQINNKDDYIEKIYKKPIINGKSFKYQYYFSNNPYSYMNVCYLSKIVLNNEIEYLLKLQRKIKLYLLKNKKNNKYKNNLDNINNKSNNEFKSKNQTLKINISKIEQKKK